MYNFIKNLYQMQFHAVNSIITIWTAVIWQSVFAITSVIWVMG